MVIAQNRVGLNQPIEIPNSFCKSVKQQFFEASDSLSLNSLIDCIVSSVSQNFIFAETFSSKILEQGALQIGIFRPVFKTVLFYKMQFSIETQSTENQVNKVKSKLNLSFTGKKNYSFAVFGFCNKMKTNYFLVKQWSLEICLEIQFTSLS